MKKSRNILDFEKQPETEFPGEITYYSNESNENNQSSFSYRNSSGAWD